MADGHAFDPLSPLVTLLAPGATRALPDFLIISPPKTGSTWLASNLRCHPCIFVPAIKEVKYFSSFYKSLDLNWYAGHFHEGVGRLKGEASPSYAILPLRMIRLVRALLPQVKLIFLMRDPVARAWSHARHNHRYREANFQNHTGHLEGVSDQLWRENFRHPWPYASGDYLGQIKRWLSVFPRQQMFIDLFERIETDPVGLLARILQFLGVRTDVDWSSFPTRETILPGPPKQLSDALKQDLRLLLRERTRTLRAFLQQEIGLSVEEEWAETLAGTSSFSRPSVAQGIDEIEDQALETLLGEMDYPNPRVMAHDFFGFDIILHRGRFLLVSHALGKLELQSLHQAVACERADIPLADSLEGAKNQVLQQVHRQLLRDFRQEQASLRAGHEESLKLLAGVRDSLLSRQDELESRLSEHHIFVTRLSESLPFRLRRWLAQLFTRRI
jgi:hypothetical protein